MTEQEDQKLQVYLTNKGLLINDKSVENGVLYFHGSSASKDLEFEADKKHGKSFVSLRDANVGDEINVIQAYLGSREESGEAAIYVHLEIKAVYEITRAQYDLVLRIFKEQSESGSAEISRIREEAKAKIIDIEEERDKKINILTSMNNLELLLMQRLNIK